MDCYLDCDSIEEMRTELLRLRQENENLRNRISELEEGHGLNDCYKDMEIPKMPNSDNYSFEDWLENDYPYEEDL